MSDVSKPYVLPAGATRLEGAMLPFKLLSDDSGGQLSICEFTFPGWSSGPVYHRHNDVDEGFFVISGALEFQLDGKRIAASAGDFAWVPRGTAHTFACASEDPVHVLALAAPGGIEHLFVEQSQYLSSHDEAPDPAVLDKIGSKHGAETVGPPITASNAPAG